MTRSFRFRLSLRFTATLAAGTAAISLFSFLTLAALLDREIDASLLNVASIQASSVTDSPDGEMRFHEWELTPEEAESVLELNRYVQVWRPDGTSLLRSQYMTGDLPSSPDALQTAAAGQLVWSEASFQGRPIRTLYYPLERLGLEHEQHVLQVAAPLGGRNQTLIRLGMFLLGINVLVLVGSGMGSWWLSAHAVRPVNEIIDQAEAVEAGTLGLGISAYADSREYQRLVQVLNSMLTRIQVAFESQRRFVADASHELRSPLTVMRGELELALRRERSSEEYREFMESTLEEAIRLSRITEDLLTLARADAGATVARRQQVDLAPDIEGLIGRLRARAEQQAMVLTFETDGSTEGSFDVELVDQVVWNLVDNAIRYSPSGSEVSVRLEGGTEGVTITVADSGPGLGPNPERLFERFLRHDPARTRTGEAGGTGLGLSIVRSLTRTMGGSVTAANRPGGGALFTVALPRGEWLAESPPAPAGLRTGPARPGALSSTASADVPVEHVE